MGRMDSESSYDAPMVGMPPPMRELGAGYAAVRDGYDPGGGQYYLRETAVSAGAGVGPQQPGPDVMAHQRYAHRLGSEPLPMQNR